MGLKKFVLTFGGGVDTRLPNLLNGIFILVDLIGCCARAVVFTSQAQAGRHI